MWTKKSVLVLGLGASLSFLGLVFRSLALMMTSILLLSYLMVSVFLVRVSRVVPRRTPSSASKVKVSLNRLPPLIP